MIDDFDSNMNPLERKLKTTKSGKWRTTSDGRAFCYMGKILYVILILFSIDRRELLGINSIWFS